MKSRERWSTARQLERGTGKKAAGEWQTSRGGPSLAAWRPGDQVNAAPGWRVFGVSLFCKRPGSGRTGFGENLSKASCRALHSPDCPGFISCFVGAHVVTPTSQGGKTEAQRGLTADTGHPGV